VPARLGLGVPVPAVCRPDFVLNGFWSVGFQINGKTREKNGGSEKGIKKAAGRRPGALWGDIGYYVQYNEVCAYKQPVSSYGLACACFCEGFVSY
jgi:hypothetical protein